MLTEDASRAPEMIPGIQQKNNNFQFNETLSSIRTGDTEDRIVNILALIIFFLPSLVWRYSLKSTAWFYAPLIYLASPDKFADPQHRRLMIDRRIPVFEWLRALYAAIILLTALVVLVDWTGFVALRQHVEVLTPLGWLLILDWGKIWDQPWQIPSFIGAGLTLGIFLWIDHLRTTRERLEKDGQDPETALNRAYSTEHHPGLTLYRLNRLRNVMVFATLGLGLWHFAQNSYDAGLLTPLDPVLSTIFGPRG